VKDAGHSKKSIDRKPALSPTRINTFLECAVKYRYVYVDKVGRFYLRARAGYSFGSTLHHVLQQFHEQGGVHTAQEMAAEVEHSWIAAGYETPQQEQEHREAGQRIVEAYHEAHQLRVADRVETIATEKTISCDMGRFILTGRVDRIDRHADGRLEIIDYKSGRMETTPNEVMNSLAMSCYQLILGQMYPGIPVFATIYSLRSGSQASAELHGDALATFERDLIILADEILSTDYGSLEPVPVLACPDCDFLPRCERFWQQREAQERDEMIESLHSDHGL
jgi:putative RecB family exonuclease